MFPSNTHLPGRFLTSLLLVFVLQSAGSASPFYIPIEPDTSLARKYLDKAGEFRDSTALDSALHYYEKAALVYADAESWELWIQARNGAGKSYLELSRMEEAPPFLRETLAKGREFLGMDHPHIAEAYTNLGNYYSLIGRYPDARDLFQNALEITLKVHGTEATQTAVIYRKLGSCLAEMGEVEKGLAYHQDALELFLKAYGEEHAEVSECYGSIGYAYGLQGNYKQELHYYLKSLEIEKKVFPPDHPNLGISYNNIGMNYGRMGDYQKQLDYLFWALGILKKNFGEDHFYVALTYNNIGFCYEKKGDHESELANTQKALDIFIKSFGETNQNVAISYNNMGLSYRARGDYEKGEAFLKKALSIQTQLSGPGHTYVGMFYNNLGGLYNDKGDYQQSLIHYQKGYETLRRVKGEDHPDVILTKHNVGAQLTAIGEIDKALAYNLETLEKTREIFGNEHRRVANIYGIIGGLYNEKGEYKKAISHYEKDLEIRLKVLGTDHYAVSQTLINMGEIYRHQHQWDQALSYFQKALINLSDEFESPDVYQNPPLHNIKSKLGMVTALGKKAETLYHKWQSSSTRQLQSDMTVGELELSLESYRLAIDLIDTIRISFTRKESRQQLVGNLIKLYDDAIRVAFDLVRITGKKEYAEDAFAITEKSKAFILLQGLKEAGAKRFAGIPDSLVEKERAIKIDLAYYEKVFEKAKQENDSVKKQIYADYLFDTRGKFDQLTRSLEASYPRYYRLKYNVNPTSLSAFQKDNLTADMAVLEYDVGDSAIFAFLLTREHYQLYKINLDFPLDSWVNKMRKGLYHYQLSGEDNQARYLAYCDTFVSASAGLYQHLVAPFEEALPEKLVVIPDGALSYLPFEALLTEVPEVAHHFKRHAYLVKHHQISYAYSATLLGEMNTPRSNAKKDLLAFAPEFEGDMPLLAGVEARRGGLGPLAYNLPEVQAIQRLWGGDVFAGAEATEANFTLKAGDYRILHLATHGKANDKIGDFSFLAFTELKDSIENERLYVRDLYNLDLNAELVVLSACETGIGELQRGEGVISLSRGFSYAGARSLVTTLWSVNDRHTRELMEAFYRNLKDGMAKDEALRQAKLDFINQQTHFDAHPFYWAGFIPVGSMKPIPRNGPFNALLFVGLGILGLLLLIWLYRRNSRLQ